MRPLQETVEGDRLTADIELARLKRDSLSVLAGKTVLITAGPTREALDAVRFLSNRSSGKMGYALAEAARDRGARVVLISGPVALEPPRMWSSCGLNQPAICSRQSGAIMGSGMLQ